jgi:hypothetical protein
MMRANLAALGAATVAGIALGGAAARATPPAASYVWQQPWGSSAQVETSQPPAWIPITATAEPFVLGASSYHWQQPGASSDATDWVQPPMR